MRSPVLHWLEALSMFWLMDAEMVIDTRNKKLELLIAKTWKERKDSMEIMTSRTWHYHRMDHKAMRTQTFVLQKFWRDHISEKNGRGGNIPPNALSVPKTLFSYAMTVVDKVEGWNEEQRVGSKFAACMWM